MYKIFLITTFKDWMKHWEPNRYLQDPVKYSDITMERAASWYLKYLTAAIEEELKNFVEL